MDAIKKINTDRWLYIFISLHVICWTFVPFFVRYDLPLDAMEGAVWGQQLQFGYDKNPYLNGWLTALAVSIDAHTGWAVYLFSQLSVAICFWAVWKLAQKMLPSIYALIAVLLLEGIQYYNVHSIDFNDNTLELSLWALTALFFYDALKKQTAWFWILTGFFAALGMMAKYFTIMLLIPMALFIIIHPENRRTFRQPAFYAGIATFLAVVAPHIVWLFNHDFVTVSYAFERVSSKPRWFNHIRYFTLFSWQQFQALLPALGLLSLLFIGQKPLTEKNRFHLNTFDKQFLFFVGVAPLLLTLSLSLFSRFALRAGWGQPLLSLWGIILLAWLQPRITEKRFYTFAIILYSLVAGTLFGYAVALIRADAPSSANFPGKILAAHLTKEWHQQFNTPLPFVAGSRWVAGNIAFYSPDHPPVYIDWNRKVSPWINENTLKEKGAIFIIDRTDTTNFPEEIIKRYAGLGQIRILHFQWLRNNRGTAPVEIAVAFLPPQEFR